MSKWTEITDKFELQNMLDDFSVFRPLMNTYGLESAMYADTQQLEEWRAHPERRLLKEDAERRSEQS